MSYQFLYMSDIPAIFPIQSLEPLPDLSVISICPSASQLVADSDLSTTVILLSGVHIMPLRFRFVQHAVYTAILSY